MHQMKIQSVEVHAVRGPRPTAPLAYRQRQVNMLSVYGDHRAAFWNDNLPDDPDWTQSLYLRIGTDAGVEGFYGPVDPEVSWSVWAMLSELLIGQDALAISILWDKMERANRHSRHGHYKIAVSAVDNALWDLKGKVFGAPVWQLLGGGQSRSRIPAYISMLGSALDEQSVQDWASWGAKEGFAGQKWFLADGPGTGAKGLARSVRIAEQLREVLGPESDLMFDVFQGWDLSFATSWYERVKELRIAWLEEPFPPSRYPAFLALHKSTGAPLASGEHLYDRSEVLPYLKDHVLVAIQADPEWCGGVTELVRVCAMSETFGVPVIPHGHGLHAALHVVASQSPALTPKMEYLAHGMPNRHHFEVSPPKPLGGSFALPVSPGFGIELDASKIDSRRVVDFD